MRRRRAGWALLVALPLIAALGILCPLYTSAFHVERAGRLLETDPTSEAGRVALLRAVDRNARNAQAYRLLALLDAARGNWASAAGAWAHFVTLRPSDPQGAWYLASVCERLAPAELGQVSEKACGADERSRTQVLARLWQSAGQTPARLVRSGDANRQRGLWDKALAFYRRALLLDPQCPSAWSGLAESFRATGNNAEALEAYSRVIALSPDPAVEASAHAARGTLLASDQRWAEASEELASAVSLRPEEGAYRLEYGWALVQSGATPEAARLQLREAARLLPGNPWPHVHLAVLAFSAEQHSTALEEANTAAVLDDGLFWAWLWRGKALAALGRPREAEDSFREAVRLSPEHAAPHADLGVFLLESLRPEEALGSLEEAVRIAPADLSYRLLLAAAFRGSGRAGEAAQVYRQILEMDPGNAEARAALTELGH